MFISIKTWTKISLAAAAFGCLCSGLLLAEGNVAIKGGTFYTITRGVVEGGVLLIENGKIKDIGKGLEIPRGYLTIRAEGKVIMPGFVVAFSQVGLEGDFIAPDSLESGEALTPQMRAIDGFYPLSRGIARLRNRGVTTAAIFPAPGNLISGQGAVLKMAGRIPQQMALKTSFGLLMTLGEKAKRESGMPKTRMGEMSLLKNIFLDMQKYLDKWSAYEKSKDESQKPSRDFKLDPLAALVRGEFPAFIHCAKVQDIMNAVSLADAYCFKAVLVDAQQASQVAGELARRKIPVLVVPQKSIWWEVEKNLWDPANASKLHRAGVEIAIVPGEGSRFGDEEIAFYAAYAVRHGLPEEEALRAITISPAKILGLESRIGSLEKGKEADIVIFDGHPFRTKTKAEKVIIDGKIHEVKEAPAHEE
jgi:imidazolonepropionase-like amidohydrolase